MNRKIKKQKYDFILFNLLCLLVLLSPPKTDAAFPGLSVCEIKIIRSDWRKTEWVNPRLSPVIFFSLTPRVRFED